jgi:hypothetical protein
MTKTSSRHSAEFKNDIRKMFEEGMTVSAIAFNFGVERGVISGILHRLKVTRDMSRKSGKYVAPKSRKYAKKRPDFKFQKLSKSKPVSLDQAEPNQCRWPVQEKPFAVCGCKALSGKPYCAAHAQKAYRTI